MEDSRNAIHRANSDSGEVADAPPPLKPMGLVKLFFACMVAGGVQYGWALQLSLLTPYVQTLGLSHTLSSVMWLCGPLAGFFVQPFVGFYSDRCRSSLGRRRPYILSGCLVICLSVLVVGFSSDLGYKLGDTKEHCSVYSGPRWHAAIVFVVGFWLLDFANNAVQGPARALMADLAVGRGASSANAIFCAWMAVGNILGYSSGSTGSWHKWFPFLMTRACCEACANLKGAFLVAVVLLLICLTVTMILAKEEPIMEDSVCTEEESKMGILELFSSFKNLPPGMAPVLFITGLTWLSWFPFILYDTDWMGREVYHGTPTGSMVKRMAYERGIREGAFGLLLNSVILGVTSMLIDPMCKMMSSRIVWVLSNFLVFLSMAAIAIISYWSIQEYEKSPTAAGKVIQADPRVRAVALAIFTALGVPLAVLYSVPFAVTAQLAAVRGGGQGLCTGVLNIAIVIPQVIVALGAGPWDALFDQGNLPAFALASAVALVAGIAGFFMLPNLSKSGFSSVGGGGH